MSTVLRILIIENHEVTASFISLFLRRAGHDVIVVPTAQAALGRDDLASFDVILSILGWREGNGGELIKNLPPKPRRCVMAGGVLGGNAGVHGGLAAG